MNYDAQVRIQIPKPGGFGITNISIVNAELTDITLTDIHPSEKKCAECLNPIVQGESIAIFELSTLNAENKIPLSEPYLVHVKNSDGKTCLEEFISRVLQSTGLKESNSNSPVVVPLPVESDKLL